MARNKFNISQKKANLERRLPDLSRILANQARSHFLNSWRSQGFEDVGLNPWAPRKRETKKSSGKAILVASGALRRAVRNSIRDVSAKGARLVVDLPYAAIHNKGGQFLAFGKYPATMPKRQFIGTSVVLGRKHLKTITRFLSTL